MSAIARLETMEFVSSTAMINNSKVYYSKQHSRRCRSLADNQRISIQARSHLSKTLRLLVENYSKAFFVRPVPTSHFNPSRVFKIYFIRFFSHLTKLSKGRIANKNKSFKNPFCSLLKAILKRLFGPTLGARL